MLFATSVCICSLLSCFGSHHLAEIFFFLLLLFDYLQIILLLLVVACFNSLGLFVVFLVDLSVILILATAALIVAEAALFIDGVLLRCHEVAMLPIERVLEFDARRIALQSLVFAGVLDDGLEVAVVLLAEGIVRRELAILI